MEGYTRLRKGSKCSFYVYVRVNEGGKHGIVSIYVYRCHFDHVPRTRPDVYYLPAHPNVMECCKYDLFDVDCVRHVAWMSMQKETYHKSKASLLELVSFRSWMVCTNLCWRSLWAKFGRLLNYGHVDTTNIVERHWQFLKYIALRGRINGSIIDIVHVLIKDSSCSEAVANM